MKVLIMPSWYYDYQGKGGGIFIKEQADALSENGIDVAIAYSALGRSYPFLSTYYSQTNSISTYFHHQFAFPKLNSFLIDLWIKQFSKVYDQYKKDQGKPDLIHAHSFLAGAVAAKLKAKEKVPYLLTEHSSAILNHNVPNRLISVVKKAYESCDQLIAVSQGLADQMKTYTDQKIIVIPNLVDSRFFTPKKMPLLKDKTIQLLSIGDPIHTKGIDILIEALNELKTSSFNFHLSLGDEMPGKQNLIQLIKQYGLEDNVTFLGQLNRAQVLHQMQNCHIYVSASRWETFGITLIEAMSCGKPIVATATAGSEDILTETSGLLVPTENPQALAEAITKVATHYKQYQPTMIRTLAQEKFDSIKIASRIKEVYESII
ncbi:MAG: glycosyltransferase [Bacteroidota bacterium]